MYIADMVIKYRGGWGGGAKTGGGSPNFEFLQMDGLLMKLDN